MPTAVKLSPPRRTESNGKQHVKLSVKIDAPNIRLAVFKIIGTSPLVVHRFSKKAKEEMIQSMINPPKRGSKKDRKPLDPDAMYNEARYTAKEGWDGFNVSGVRNALISACRLGNAKMTMAKLCIFVQADGFDKEEPQYGLIRIYGEPKRFDSICRLKTGAPNPTYRPSYWPWSAILRIRYDSDQFSMEDIANLLTRVGEQVGLCEGRPDSRDSAGQGWGLFRIENQNEDEQGN